MRAPKQAVKNFMKMWMFWVKWCLYPPEYKLHNITLSNLISFYTEILIIASLLMLVSSNDFHELYRFLCSLCITVCFDELLFGKKSSRLWLMSLQLYYVNANVDNFRLPCDLLFRLILQIKYKCLNVQTYTRTKRLAMLITGCTTLRGVRAEEKKTEKETVVGQSAEEKKYKRSRDENPHFLSGFSE